MAGNQESAAQSLASIHITDKTTTEPSTDPLLKPSSPKKRFRSPDPVAAGLLSKSTSPRTQPTGISEMTEAKRRKTGKENTTQISRNPAAEALNVLAGAQVTSKASDAPTSLMTSTTSPAITSAILGGESSSANTTSTNIQQTAAQAQQVVSPGAMDQDDPAESTGPKAFSYPGPPNVQFDPKRGVSLPGSNSNDNSKPGTNKKHKCPYCDTEFTRHHNLKSHLLTHSHEKPYMCQTCDSRFRRLHDLKRHTKLHTGERPHICPKCNRRFARGDALARHAKGQGGCAGRRSSIGEFGDGHDESMDGMVYTDGPSQEPENMDEDEAGGSSLPSIRHHAPPQSYRSDTSPIFSQQGSTYPPIAAKANMGRGLHPPIHPSSGSSGGQPGSGYHPSPYPAAFQMTESPKPLSPHVPTGGDPRDRGHSYPRRRNTPPPSLPPPAVSTTGTQLPSLAGLAPPDSRYTLHSTPNNSGPSPTLPHPASGTFPPHSASNSLSSHGTGAFGSGERTALPYSGEERLWAVVKSLEAKVERLEDEIRMLRAQQTSPTQTMASAGTGPLSGR